MLLLYYISFLEIGSLQTYCRISTLYSIPIDLKKGARRRQRFYHWTFLLFPFWCRRRIAKRSICLSLIFLFSLQLKGSDWLLQQPQRLKSFLWFKCYTPPDILHTLIFSNVPFLVVLSKDYFTHKQQAYCNMMCPLSTIKKGNIATKWTKWSLKHVGEISTIQNKGS